MVGILGEKSGAFRTVPSQDIEQFLARDLHRYDAVVLNNNCPTQQDRDVFRDVLINQVDTYGAKYKDLPLEERGDGGEAVRQPFTRLSPAGAA